MSETAPNQRSRFFLASAAASPREQRWAAIIAIVAVIAFAAVVPFARTALPRIPAFIASYQAALFFIDLITAVLLFEQVLRLRSLALLVLASGYLFDALMIVAHTLSFPGAFSETGLLGSREQTTAWLYVFWHGGFPLFVLAYVALSRRDPDDRVSSQPMGAPIVMAVMAVAALVIALTLWTTVGHDTLPIVMQGSDYSMLVSKGISPAVWLLTLAAVLALWPRRHRILDLWLMVVMWIWLFDIALAAVVGSKRFDLGFYAGRLFGLIAASFLLVMLLVELGRLYSGLVGRALGMDERLQELLLKNRSEQSRRPKDTDAFIQQQNIARYKEFLASGVGDQAQRAAIRKLLAEEEAKLGPSVSATKPA